MIYQRTRGRIGGRVMSGLNGQHSGRAGMLSGVAAAIAGMTLNWASSPGNLLPSGFSLTRASDGTYFDSAGLLQTAATDVARGTYRYNGSAWVFDGTMIEAAATNLNQNSRLASGASGWLNFTADTFPSNTSPSPDGTNTSVRVVPTAVAGYHATYGTGFSSVLNTDYTVSFDVRQDGASPYNIMCGLYDGAARLLSIEVNVATGAILYPAGISAGGTLTTPGTVTRLGNGYWRVTLGGQWNSTATMYPCFWVTDASGANLMAGDGVNGLVVDNVQLEQARGISSTIVTPIGSTASRAADVVTATTSGLQAGAQGFAAGAFRLIAEAVTGQGTFLSTDTGGGVAGAQSYWFGGAMYMYDTTGGAFGVAATPTVGAVNKVAVSWGAGTNGWQNSLNGVVASGSTAFDGNMNFAGTMRIGASTTGTLPCSMVLQSMRLGVQTVNNSRLANPFA